MGKPVTDLFPKKGTIFKKTCSISNKKWLYCICVHKSHWRPLVRYKVPEGISFHMDRCYLPLELTLQSQGVVSRMGVKLGTGFKLSAASLTFAASLGRSKGIRWRIFGGNWVSTSAFRRRIMIWLSRWCNSSRLDAPRQSHCLRGPKNLCE